MLYLFRRCNMTKFLWDSMLHVRPNVLNEIQIWRIWGILVALYFQFQSDWNTNLFVDRSIVFHDNWLFQILKRLFPKLLKRSCKDLVSINSRVDLLSICQLKKQSRSHLTPPECPPEHHPSQRWPWGEMRRGEASWVWGEWAWYLTRSSRSVPWSSWLALPRHEARRGEFDSSVTYK